MKLRELVHDIPIFAQYHELLVQFLGFPTTFNFSLTVFNLESLREEYGSYEGRVMACFSEGMVNIREEYKGLCTVLYCSVFYRGVSLSWVPVYCSVLQCILQRSAPVLGTCVLFCTVVYSIEECPCPGYLCTVVYSIEECPCPVCSLPVMNGEINKSGSFTSALLSSCYRVPPAPPHIRLRWGGGRRTKRGQQGAAQYTTMGPYACRP